jgi:ligand-binding sensor domain-containing protein
MSEVRLLFLVLFTSVTIVVSGQKFTSLNDQLPFARARCMYQDSYGFLWFGTVDGLVKYDGVSIRSYRNVPGARDALPGQEINALVENSDSTLLLGFQDMGLVQFNRNTCCSEIIPLAPEDDRCTVNCLLIDRSNIVWVGTSDGLFSLDGDQVTHFAADPSVSDGLQNPVVLTLFEDRYLNLWVGTREGIHRLERPGSTFESPKTNSSFPDLLIIDLDEDLSGQLWVSVRVGPNRLYTWDQNEKQFIADRRFTRDGEYRIDFDAQNAMWISSRGRGVHRILHGVETFFDPSKYWKHGLWGLGTSEVVHDKYRNIWILGEEVFRRSGDQKGFYAIAGDNFTVHSVYADDQYIWYCADVPMRWSKATGHAEKFLENFTMRELRRPVALNSQSRIYHFEEWGEDLVMSTTRNMIVWDRSKDKLRDLPTDAGGPLRDFVIDANGYAWVATNQRLPLRMHLSDGAFDRLDVLAQAYTSHAVAMAPNGLQWWGNRQNGLFSFDPVTEELSHFEPVPESPESSISSFEIHDILIHSDGSVWVGTKFGLDVIDPETKRVRRYHLKGKNINTQITSLLEGEEGTLWIGTNNGLLFLNPDTDSLRRFTQDDGLINTVFTERACFKDEAGVLYFGGDAGVDFFHPDAIGTNPVPPDLYIKSASVNQHLMTDSLSGECLSELSLSHQENFIEIELIGIHLASPNSVTYAYRLPMQSDEWIDLGRNRVISLVRIPPGKYLLEARCANGDGVWSMPKQLLTINIRPPFWQTPWFLGIGAFAILALSYALYQFRIRQIRSAERVKTELTRRIGEIEMKALRAQMNPHFLFNSLNSVRLLIDTGDKQEAKRYLTKYSQLVRQILNNSRNRLVRLDQELETLHLYLELEKMRFKQFSYMILVMDEVETDFIEVPPLLLQPYVENALWHGLMNKQDGDKKLLIEVKREGDFVLVVIEDNGIGREQAHKLQSRSRLKKESLGIRISEDRLSYLKDLYGTEVQLEIIDLHDPTGTRVVFRLPVAE